MNNNELDNSNLKNKILELKEKRKAIIVAHNYQIDEIQEIADIVGDSLALSKYCASNDKKVIVFCGVHFMAESAKILSKEKIVLLPEKDAGCPMADMVTAEALKEEKRKNPDFVVVCYINSSAEVKAESDICCTSSNAIKVVSSIKQKNILFVPDKNLGAYIASKLPEKNIKLWNGYCITHHKIKLTDVQKIKEMYPYAKMLVHPECQQNIIEIADFVGSTKEIIDFASISNETHFIIGTEMGVLYALKKNNPNKKFNLLSQGLICPNMKKNSLKSVYECLDEMKYNIEVDEDIMLKAKKSLDRMLEISK